MPDSAAEGVSGAKTPLITLNATGSNHTRMPKWIAMVAAINEHLPPWAPAKNPSAQFSKRRGLNEIRLCKIRSRTSAGSLWKNS